MKKENYKSPRLEAGTVLNEWTILYFEKKVTKHNRHTGYVCRCSCGVVKRVDGYNLKSGISKSCGHLQRSAFVEQGTKALHYAIIYTIYRNYCKQAALRDYPFDLSLDDFQTLILQNCHYCGESPSNTFKSGKRAFNGIESFRYNGVDRMINSKGYTPDNVVPCCQKCNFAKKDFNYDEWTSWIKRVYGNLFLSDKFNDYPKGVEQKPMLLEKGSTQKG